MKQFVLLIKESLNENVSEKSPEQLQAEYLSWIEQMGANTTYKGGNRLNTNQIIIDSQGVIEQDGPFVEPKELIGGLVIFEAEDRGRALEVVRSSPFFKYHALELRESEVVYE